MSKERLEEIKEHEIIADNECGEYERHKVDFYYEHVGWLIEQAERVEELERQNTPGVELNLLNAEVSDLEQQNKRYREALEFYANRSNWMNIEVPTVMDGEPEMVTREPLIFDDGGRKAREALEGDKE